MTMIEIKEDKFDNAYEHVEKALKAMGKVMQCFTEWEEESEMMGQRGGGYGNRGGYGSRSMMGQRGGYGNRSGYSERDEWEDYEEMGERRGVRGSGRGR